MRDRGRRPPGGGRNPHGRSHLGAAYPYPPGGCAHD